MRVTTLFKDFFHNEKASGLVLMGCFALSLILANSSIGDQYLHFWHSKIGGFPMEFWINDGLMTIFFLLIGLEIERELYVGELSIWRNALLPVIAAIGGMVVPAAIYYVLNHDTLFARGIGIPMATDIAFSLGVLSLLGSRVPNSLKIFLTALAIIDDLGAILVIALFYSKGFSQTYFLMAAFMYGVLLLLKWKKVNLLYPYLILGAVMWFFMLKSGIHATITGVLLAFAIPFGQRGEGLPPSYRLQHALHFPVAFLIVPIFALANTGIQLPDGWIASMTDSNGLGIIGGLAIGKPLGILGFSMLAAWAGLCTLPNDLKWIHIFGAGILAGIGFTMSIFITLLAFDVPTIILHSKIAIFVASVGTALLGLLILWLSLPNHPKQATDEDFVV